MPEFTLPQRAIIETGGGEWLGTVLVALAAFVAIGATVAFILAHLVLLAVCAAVFVAVIGGLAVASAGLPSRAAGVSRTVRGTR